MLTHVERHYLHRGVAHRAQEPVDRRAALLQTTIRGGG
jgi:hypothetical protein